MVNAGYSCIMFFSFYPFILQITSFQVHWDNYVQVDMGFGKYELLYPDVPHQPLENRLVTLMFSAPIFS